jgi:predicted cobalt transporter CbtA
MALFSETVTGRMRSTRIRLLSLAVSAAVLILAVANLTHIHGVSDPDAHHTPTDFMLQFQTQRGILLSDIVIFILVCLLRTHAVRVTRRSPAPQRGVLILTPRAPPGSAA